MRKYSAEWRAANRPAPRPDVVVESHRVDCRNNSCHGECLGEAKMRRALDGVENADREEFTAWDRKETEPCEAGTVGCSVRHTDAGIDSECETW